MYVDLKEENKNNSQNTFKNTLVDDQSKSNPDTLNFLEKVAELEEEDMIEQEIIREELSIRIEIAKDGNKSVLLASNSVNSKILGVGKRHSGLV